MYLSDSEAQDFELVRHLVNQAISSPVTDIKRLPGTMAYNYEIDHKHVFKLPCERTNQEDWLRQAQLAPVLQQYFTFQIPQPNLKTLHLFDGKTILSSFYPKIEGICFSDDCQFAAQDRSFKTRFFEQVSDAAAQIHAVPLTELPFQLPTKIDYLEKCFFKESKGDNYLAKKLFRKLLHNSFLGLGKSGSRTSLLAHTDLHSGNILLDDKNKLVAVLDFDMLVRGDRFLEFRPGLYPDILDNRLFQKIYQERTGIKIDMKDVYQHEIMQNSLRWFYGLYQLYQVLPARERDKKIKRALRQKVNSERY
ncbi:MAG: phosphotransferase [Alphaproteobacteria bacterium]|nr:phosphotransferase [Alphaproteobacteria bacterium]